MIPPPPPGHLLDPSLPDLIVVFSVAGLLLFSLTAIAFILHFHLSSPRSDRLRGLNSLWAVRVLLITFACLWALAELLRLPNLVLTGAAARGDVPHRGQPRVSSLHLCHAYVLASHGFAEPCFFVTLLFLLQASLDESLRDRHPNAFVNALAVSLGTSLPFLLLHVLFLSPYSSWVLRQLGVLPELFGRVVGGIDNGQGSATTGGMMRCSYPQFSTLLLAGFGAVYVPWFVSVCWRAVSVVINKRLRVRLYALAAAVVLALSVQVAAFALTAFWNPEDAAFQMLGLAGFLTVLMCALVGEGILVVRPIRDAMEVGCWCGGGGTAGSGEGCPGSPPDALP